MTENEIGKVVVDAALKMHRELGPGLREFGSRLEPWGFQRLSSRKWVRAQKLPIRELFVIGALKGAPYSPS